MSSESVVGDPSFDRYARLVRRTLGVPVALVSIVEENRQVFPGAEGLPDPYQQCRETPLSHSFCQYVVKDEQPLVIADARLDDRLSTNLAITDLHVIAYAGWPLHDHTGRTIGSLCAIDTEPRAWTSSELELLEDLAAVCSSELALREREREATSLRRVAEQVAEREQVLLALSEGLAATRTLSSVAAAIEVAAVDHLGCVRAGFWLDPDAPRGHGRRGDVVLDLVTTPHDTWPRARDHARLPADLDNPVGATFLTGRPLYYRDHEAQNAMHHGVSTTADVGEGRAFLPLRVDDVVVGTLVLLWPERRYFVDEDRATLTALTSYTAQAVQRALLVKERAHASVTLQNALLTDLPVTPHCELAARYRPASSRDRVGGDWYDALVLDPASTALVIGDVVGHDIRAAADMGQLRATLRALTWSGEESPATTLRHLDRSLPALGIDALATVVHAQVRGALLTWSSAGHPPPLVVTADGRVTVLEPGVQDTLVGVAPDSERHESTVALEPGSTVLLYTDGLVERRHELLDVGLARLAASVAEHHRLDVDALVDRLLADLVPDDRSDDVAVLAARFHGR